jgi:hypothetical protein
MSDPILAARIRAQSYWYRDGLTDIFLGIVCILQSGWLLVMNPGNRQSAWFLPVTLMYLLLLAAFSMGARRIMAATRERITYPRSGYAEPGETVRRLRIWIVASTILAVVAAALAFRYAGVVGWDPDRWVQWTPAVAGLTNWAVSLYVSVRYGLLRYLLVGLLSIALGVAVSIEFPPRLATEIWLAGVGCAWLGSGGVTLWSYVRTKPLSADET